MLLETASLLWRLDGWKLDVDYQHIIYIECPEIQFDPLPDLYFIRPAKPKSILVWADHDLVTTFPVGFYDQISPELLGVLIALADPSLCRL